jgi:Transposase DDE domain
VSSIVCRLRSLRPDSGTQQIERLTERGVRPLVKPDAGQRKTPGKTRQRKPHYQQMREQLASDEGKQLYRQRQAIIEPVFAQTKHNRRIDRYRGLGACRAEWRHDHRHPQLIEALAARTSRDPGLRRTPGPGPRTAQPRVARTMTDHHPAVASPALQLQPLRNSLGYKHCSRAPWTMLLRLAERSSPGPDRELRSGRPAAVVGLETPRRRDARIAREGVA